MLIEFYKIVKYMMKRERFWRRLLKKNQRKRRRQKSAKKRDEKLLAVDDDTEVLCEEKEALIEQFTADKLKHDAEEEAWIRREQIAQERFAADRHSNAEEQKNQENIRLKQKTVFDKREAIIKKLQENIIHKTEAVQKDFDNTMLLMELYLENENLECPKELERILESRPGIKICEFYQRTNCCRYGYICQYNHKRPLLSRIILIRHFFTHPMLDIQNDNEYDECESALEFSEDDLIEQYNIFFNDVVPEMEKFGKIRNFRTTRNVYSHLRGHVFVEYFDKRSALRAFIKLQGRFYATRRLNVEFSNINLWRESICGLSVTKKCPKGQNCYYFHIFNNPHNKYNTPLEYVRRNNGTPYHTIDEVPPTLSWDDICRSLNQNSRNWSWSESPIHDTHQLSYNNNVSAKLGNK